MRTLIQNGRIWTGADWLDDHTVIVEDGLIQAVVPLSAAPECDETFDLDGGYLAPGFIDIQVNGGGGVLFNDTPSVETIRQIGHAHRQYGTTGFLTTLISDELEKMDLAIQATEDALHDKVPGVLGVHLEGPFLSIDKKGVHDPKKFRELTPDHLDRLASLSVGRTLVTLAPERSSPSSVAALVDAGVIVSIGHTNASHAEALKTVEAGATGFTHLFNAMSSITSRDPGVVGCALSTDNSWCGIIVDGKHVATDNLKIALRCKGPEKLILVTDAMPTVGMQNKNFLLGNRLIEVHDGVCVTKDGTLAGSDLDMITAVRNTAEWLDVELGDAFNMASLYPAEFLKLDHQLGRIEVGYRASLVALSPSLEVTQTWIDGHTADLPDDLPVPQRAVR